jgi:hypothetical protein
LKHSRIYSLVAGIALAFAGTSALAARDLNRLLEGEYTYAGTGYCVGSLLGFNENFQAQFGPGGGTFVSSHNVNGVIVFNGDGTGTFSARSMQVNSGGASAVDFTGDVTYELAIDEKKRETVSMSASGSAAAASSRLPSRYRSCTRCAASSNP